MDNRILPVLLTALCLLTTPAAASYLIEEFCPDGYAKGDGDEYFILTGNGSLAGWSVSDGEGTISFSGGSGRTIVARDGSLYYSIHTTYPDYEIIDSTPAVKNAAVSGKFQMANTGDQLYLRQNGRIIQSIAWPEDVVCGNGRIHFFENGVWDARVLKIGQSRFAPQTFTADSITLFVSPDSSFDVLTSVIDRAASDIRISMYEFTHPALAEHLAAACKRGVRVTLLMEGGPVGGMSAAEKGVLNYLEKNGADVYTIESVSGLPARYRYIHTKYLIADGKTTVVLSENFKESGIPLTGTKGNRGWGAAVTGTGVAEYFGQVFSADMAGYDIHPYTAGKEGFPEVWTDENVHTLFPPKTLHNVQVTPVIAPDTSSQVAELLASAKRSVDIEQAYISPYPDGAENPWLGYAVAAAERGAVVRVILDGMYYNTMDDADNDELAASLNRMGIGNLQAKLFADREGITKVHNKGAVIDGRFVLVSSINWNYNSPVNNREAGLIIESPEAAKYFSRVFAYDWRGDVPADPVSAGIGFDVRWVLCGVILAALGVLVIYVRRR